MTIGQLLKRARINAGLTQIELAKAAKITQATVSILEAGRDVKISMLQRWARACGVTVSEMLVGLK